jgi:tetratricopeptide (TPR) repeat protein
VINVLIGLLGTLLAVGEPASPGVRSTVRTVSPPTEAEVNDPVEKEFRKLMADDDDAQEEVDKWITENQAFAAKGAGVSDNELNRRIRQRFEPIRKGYEEFLKQHPEHAKAHVAFGSFLGDLHEEDAAQVHLEKALSLNSKDPAVYNNLANIYGHTGPVKKAFEYYAKAVELNPNESVYYHNFGTTVYLFRKDAMEFYGITEQQVFDKALELYRKAMALDPTNFPLASDVAQTYYGIKPPRTEEALKAWTNALTLAHDDIEREGVYLHFARLKLHAGRLQEAQGHLDSVTDAMYADLKKRLVHNLNEREGKTQSTNEPAAAVEKK